MTTLILTRQLPDDLTQLTDDEIIDYYVHDIAALVDGASWKIERESRT